MAAVHPMEVVRNYLGPQYEAILHWAVGPDWMQHSFHEWPALIQQHTGLQPAEDMETTFDMLRHAWEAARPSPATVPPPATAWPGSPADMGPMDMRATSIPGPRGVPPRPAPPRVAPPPPQDADAQHRVVAAGSLDLLIDRIVDEFVERLISRIDSKMAERLGGGGRGL